MWIARFGVRIFTVGILAVGADLACSQGFPSKPIRIVTSAPGGGTDVVARLIAQRLSSLLGQSVIVDNRGSGQITGEIVSHASRDGYTLLIAGSTFWIGPLLQKTPYDPVREFSTITLATKSPRLVSNETCGYTAY